MSLLSPEGSSLPAPYRDSITRLANERADPPVIVSVSDVHGYLDAARSALLAPTEHPDFDPVVTVAADGTLHWAGGNYVLVFNGDLVDRGPENEAVLRTVRRLAAEAPPGRVRVTLGNHEAIALSPDHFGFDSWYSGRMSAADRRGLLESVLSEYVVAAYEGYNVTYAHAGAPTPYEASEVNDELVAAARDLLEASGTAENGATQRRVLDEYARVLGVGEGFVKGPGAGLVWLDFSHLPEDAPPQVVGHTRHRTPQRKGDVFCQNVIRENLDRDGGEAVFVETPETLSALARGADGGVDRTELARF